MDAPNDQYGLLSDSEIMKMGQLLINPFVTECPPGAISYGLTSCGYDLRIDKHFMVFEDIEKLQKGGYRPLVVDPKAFNTECCRKVIADEIFQLQPHGFALAVSVERVTMPRNIIGICCGKSTYARCGLIVNVTPIEPGWEGYVTLELSNTTPLPVRIYPNEGICQLLFFETPYEVKTSYADKKGIYQNQTGITLPRTRPTNS